MRVERAPGGWGVARWSPAGRAARRAAGAARTCAERAAGACTAIGRLGEVTVLRWLGRTDHRRWRRSASLEAWWDERTRLLAGLVPPGSRVIEFGAGRRQLEVFLGPGSTYIPSDLVDRGPGTIVCDLNREPLPDLQAMRMDVAVFGGVLEYIVDLPALVESLARSVRFCAASYACVGSRGGLRDRLRDRLDRTRYGYMNHFREPELVGLFAERGFGCRDRRSWQSQRLFLFERDLLPDGRVPGAAA